MNDSHRVGRVEHAHDWLKQLDNLRRSQTPTLLDLVSQGVAFDVLHHHVNRAVGCRAQVIDSDCVRVTKTARGLSFALEASQPLRIGAHLRRQNLDGDAIAQ